MPWSFRFRGTRLTTRGYGGAVLHRFTAIALLSALFAGLAVVFPGCSQPPDPWADTKEGQPRVLALFPPLYCFAANVAKGNANVLCLLTGTGPHDYEATPSDARKLAGADLFFVNGVGLDEFFVKDLLRLARSKKLKADALGDAIDPKLLERMAEHDHGDGHHHHGDHDPHVWLSPKHAQTMIAALAKKLGEHDPGHKSDYEKNAAEYIGKIKELEAYGHEQFKGKTSKSFIATHESLRYFANDFGLDLIDSIQPQPGVEADPNQLARLVDVCKTKNVRVIAVEPQYSRQQAEMLAKVIRRDGKIEVKIALVDPLETAAPAARGNPDPNFYYDRMKANIDELAKAFP
jgi:ABC-type Zn uptake system ZnuABC Zn-binding protein ZnuA